MSLPCLLFVLLSVESLVKVSGQVCRGCKNNTDDSCHVFDPPTNSKYVGCYGTFEPGDMQSLCADGFKVMGEIEALSEGFTLEMCQTVTSNDMFFLNIQGGTLTTIKCNRQAFEEIPVLGENALAGAVFGCGTPAPDLSAGCSDDGSCLVNGTQLTTVYCSDDVPGIIDSVGQLSLSTLSLLDSSYGGVICIREPTTAPTDQPTFAPTQPTFNPSGMPSSTPTYQPSTDPTRAPTRMPTFTRFPTNQPTTIPSKMPSNNPSTIPSYLPTEDPTSAPTPAPSNPPTTTKKQQSNASIVPGLDWNELFLYGGIFILVVLCCVCLVIVLIKKNQQDDGSKSSKKDKAVLQMGTNQHATINTTTPAQYETDMAQFSIGNIVKTKK